MSANLASFTDVLGDEICNSQPLSLSSSCDSISNALKCANKPNVLTVNVRPPKGTGQCGQNRSTEEIDPKYRHVFTYPYFNQVQSNVIEDALYSDKSLVICAPTGSGKTVIFEMAIVQLLMELEDTHYEQDFKIIYMAPVKALCTERLTEWYPKFTKLGLMCIEVTGDTEVDFGQLKPYKIIITTPEKWDILTRRWRDHRALVEVIKLFLIDEVHILNDEVRGPVLEAVVSRMKTIESSAQSAHRIEKLQKEILGEQATHKHLPRIRFVAVSATVSNPEDVSSWLGTSEKPAVYYKYGDECRPVKLKRVVEGYPYSEGASMFKFDIILNYKLWPVIQKYHAGKPTLIFCNTRKSVILTAETLSRELTIGFNAEQKAKLTALASTIKNKKLQALVLSGVGCHHAGLLYEERMNIEHAFRNKDLPILITTTTLAMGVNLPAHLVIVKNTQQYVNGAYQEYSISTVLQMVGRAGRPQFDTEATAVIMTRSADKARYQALLGGCEPLQSFLHKRLAENLNSEAALGTVGDVAQCVQWLRSTFLYVRALQDPRKYLGLPQNSPQQHITKKIEELCVRAMNGLASAGLITMDEASCIESTEAGRLMSLYYLDLETMKHIMKIDGSETLEKLLQIICESHELADMHLRVDERRTLNALNRNNNSATIRFPMKGKISTRQMKLNCVIQAVLGCLPIVDPSLNQEAMKVMRIAERVCRCLVAYITRTDLITPQPQFYSAILNSILLAKCVVAHLWENSPYMCKQLKGIGPAFSTLLASAGKTNFTLLEESHPRDLERLMNKGPPVGNLLRKQISFLPKYQLTMIPRNERTVLVQLVLLNQAHLLENMDNLTAGRSHRSYIVVGDSVNHLLLLASFKDQDLITVFEGTITYEIRRKHDCEHKIFAHCISSQFVGIDDQTEYNFNSLELYETTITKPRQIANNKQVQKQTCITDTFKERKRKSTTDIEKVPKENKIKKNSFMEHLKPLKEAFEGANISINNGINKQNTNNINVLHDENAISIPNDKSAQSDDSIDDEKIDNILTEIEREMANNSMKPTKTSNILQNTNIQMAKYNSATAKSRKPQQIANFNTTCNAYKAPLMPMKTRKFNGKSNFTFLDILEKNTDLGESDNEIPSPRPATGFSDAIKGEIQKYLLTTQNKCKEVDKPLEIMLDGRQVEHVEEIIESQDSDKTEIVELNSDYQRKVDDKTPQNIEHTSKYSKIYTNCENRNENTNNNPKCDDKEIHVDLTDEFHIKDIDIVDLTLLPEVTLQTKQNDLCKKDSSTVTEANNIPNDNQLSLYSDILTNNLEEVKMLTEDNVEENRNICTTLKRQLSDKENTFEVDIGEFNDKFKALNVTHDYNSSSNVYNKENRNKDTFVANNKGTELDKKYVIIPYRKPEEMQVGTTNTPYTDNNEPNTVPTSSVNLHIMATNERYGPEVNKNYTEPSHSNTPFHSLDSISVNGCSNRLNTVENDENHTQLCLQDTNNRNDTKFDTQNNKRQYINKYSYAATKIAVSNKQVSDCHVQVIKKVKLAWNITEIITPCGSKDRKNAGTANKFSKINEFDKGLKKNNEFNDIDFKRNGIENYTLPDEELTLIQPEVDETINDDRRLQYYSPNKDKIVQQASTNTSSKKYKEINFTKTIMNTPIEDRKNYASTSNITRELPNPEINYIDSERNNIKNYTIPDEEFTLIQPKVGDTTNDDKRLQCYSPSKDTIVKRASMNTNINTSNKNDEEINLPKSIMNKPIGDTEQKASTSDKTREVPKLEIIDKDTKKRFNNVIENPIPQEEPTKELFKCNTAVQNVLQKYLNIAGEKNTFQKPSMENRTTLNKINNRNKNRESTTCTHSRKPFKMSDIHRLEARLPETLLIPDTPNNNIDIVLPETARKIIEQNYRDEYQEGNNEIHQQDYITHNDIQNQRKPNINYMEHNTPNTSPEHNADLDFLPPSYIEEDNHMKLDINMFDPKTLLQCVNEDSGAMIPPPPQFCDDNVYSPQHYDETANINEFMEEKSNDFETSFNGIFEEEVPTMLTPSKEIETWTLDKEDVWENPKHFTVMHHNNTSDEPSSFSRSYDPLRNVFHRNRLEKFKFNHKSKWKARK